MCEVIKFYGNQGAYGFLSNFYHAPFRLDGAEWQTVEHFFQAAKTFEPAEQKRVREASTPAKAKSLGRKVKLRKDWETVKIDVMRRALMTKFSLPDLREQLLATGDAKIIESAPRDYYWGCGASGAGKNKLGTLLMEVREALRA